MSGYTPDEKLRLQQLTKLRRQWLKDQELSPREPVVKPEPLGRVAKFWAGFLEPKSLWRLYTRPYGIVEVKPRLFPGDTVLETGEVVPDLPEDEGHVTPVDIIMMEPTKMRLRTQRETSSGKASRGVMAEASPDSKCPICLDRFNNMAYLDRCLHRFCFRCIHEWSKNKAECPLCKQGFNSIFHTIKAEDDFKEFVLRPMENGSFGSTGGHRFRYRTTLTRERQEAQERRTSPPPDNGVIFEGLAGPASVQPDRGVRRMMTRLAARKRAQSEGQMVRTLREQEMIRFRRALYRAGVRVRSVRDGGRYRDTSAEFYRSNPACLHRLVPWLKRELTVLYGAHGSLVNIVQHIIMSWITRYDMEDQAMQEELRPFLLGRTDHFLHEFISFARAPFNMEAYDQHAIYDCPGPSSLEDSSSDASVIAISEDEDNLGDRQPVSAADSTLSHAPWDDETPGPSYSSTEQALPPPLAVSESESESSTEEAGSRAGTQQSTQVKADPTACEGRASSPDEEDCVIIGYIKPMAERTPELVQLSSDSEESVGNETPPPQPQHIRFPSLSPASSTSSLGSKCKSPRVPMSEVKDGERPSARPEDRPCSSPWSPHRHGALGARDKISKKHHRTDERAHGERPRRQRDRSRERRRRSRSREERSFDRMRRRSRSTDWSRSARSPILSVNSDTTVSRSRGRSRSHSWDRSRSHSRDRWSSRGRSRAERRDRDRNNSSSQYDREKHSKFHSYHRDSRSCYTREREGGSVLYSHSRSYHVSSHGNVESWTSSCSRSRTPTRSYHRDKRCSRSLSNSSSPDSRSGRRRPRHDKPSGKRKYKTRHLEDSVRECSAGLHTQSPSRTKEKRPSSERRHKKTRKKSRSPSVEIIFEGKVMGENKRRHKKKKKHKKRSRRRKSSAEPEVRCSPTVITINSDSEHKADADPLDLRCPASSDEAPTATSKVGETQQLESILREWEGPIQPVNQGGRGNVCKVEVAVTADNIDSGRHDRPQAVSEQVASSPRGETSISSTSNIGTESHLLGSL
ncbi:hypothetical protein JZ751_012626 [Albula glossodonta]|uniref:E3 ubiquitin-protein ligase Topors n=1 Tax=Albula glossodonta TaxID=121402 RepID=A0A8T2NVI9_9TELE|nr:hypothetical protein JZ751_012626 [Albula glossodonta]